MEMQGSRALPVTQQQAWDALNDPEVLKTCIPGCDKVEVTGDGQFTVGVAVKIGPVSARFTGKVTLSELNPPESYTLNFDGQGGAAGFGRGVAHVKLTPADPGCELTYTVQAQVGGKLAQVGQRLVDGVARSMAEDFFKRFDDEMGRRFPVEVAQVAERAPATAQPTPVTREPGRAKGVPSWVWVAGVIVVAALAWLALR